MRFAWTRGRLLWGALFVGFIAITTDGAQAATQGFALTPFQSVRVEAPVRVVVRTGRGVSANAEGDRQMLDRLKLSVNGGILTIRLGAAGIGAPSPRSGRVTVSLSTDRLTRLLLNGSGSVDIDRLTGERGDIAIAGAGTVTVGNVALDRLSVTLSGSGGARLAGKAKIADIDLAGAGSIDAAALSIGQLSLRAEGSGNATLAASVSADIRASGAGDVTVAGKAACKVAHSGGGRIVCGGVER